MTVELDIVERKNEENLKLSKQMSDTMKKLNIDENEPIAPIAPTIDAADLEITHANTAPSTDLQRFYAGKNIFITGGTGTKYFIFFSSNIYIERISLFILFARSYTPSLSPVYSYKDCIKRLPTSLHTC